MITVILQQLLINLLFKLVFIKYDLNLFKIQANIVSCFVFVRINANYLKTIFLISKLGLLSKVLY